MKLVACVALLGLIVGGCSAAPRPIIGNGGTTPIVAGPIGSPLREPAAVEAQYKVVSGTDERALPCGAGPGGYGVRALLEIPDGPAFWTLFPKAGLAPEMAEIKEPLLLAIYVGDYPGPIEENPLDAGGEKRTAPPNTGSVCAVFPDGSRVVYADVPLEGSRVPAK